MRQAVHTPAGSLLPREKRLLMNMIKSDAGCRSGIPMARSCSVINPETLLPRDRTGKAITSRWFYERMGNLTSYHPAKNWKNQAGAYEYYYDFLGRVVDTVSPEKEHKRLFRNFDGDITGEVHPVR